MPQLTLIALQRFPEVQPGDSLSSLILKCLETDGLHLADGDVVVLAQKVVSKSEDRFRWLDEVEPSPRARELAAKAQKDARLVELVLLESREVLRCHNGVIVVEDVRGFVLANAGIDASNVPDSKGRQRVLLLPSNPDESAARIRRELESASHMTLGVVINDSWGRAWRTGTIGTAVGISGIPGLMDLRGVPDRHGRALQTTEVGIGDELAAAASLLMGQAAEGRPVVLVRGFPYPSYNGTVRELLRPVGMDMFR